MDFPMDFGCFKSVSSMFSLQLLLILNFNIAILSKCAKETHRLGPMDSKKSIP
jgi:hypothetical protein